MGQAKFVVAILFITLFTIAIVSYVSIYAFENNAAVSIESSNSLSTINSSMQSNSAEFVTDINDTSSGFTQSTVEASSDTLKSPSIFQNLKITRNSIGNVLRLMRYEIFGNNPSFMIVLSAISGFIVFLAVLYIWKTFKSGDPD